MAAFGYAGYAPPALETVNEFQPSGTTSLYNTKDRPRRDAWATWAYCALAALTALWGIAAFASVNPKQALASVDFYYSSTSCNVDLYTAAHPPSDIDGDDDVDQTMAHSLTKALAFWMPVTAAVGLVSGAVYVLLFRRYAQAMVFTTVIASLALSYVFAFVTIFSDAPAFGIVLLVGAVILSVFYWWIRDRLRMCARLLSVAGTGLRDNATLVPAAVGIKVSGVAVMGYMFAALVCAFFVGSVKPANVALRVGNDAEGHCEDYYHNRVPCCYWEPTTWAGAYAFFASVTIAWTSMIVLQIKLYTVAGTIAQWYFAPEDGVTRRGSVRLALRHCLTSSFGTVSFAAAVLALIRALRRALERGARENLVGCIINCLAQPLLRMMEMFTQFTTIAAAITGEGFVDAARNTFSLLKRNFLRTYSVWWVPEMCINMAVLLFSATWATIVYLATSLTFAGKSKDDQTSIAISTAALCFLCVWFILYFVGSLLLDVVNTVYICYAMDRDANKITHPEVHAIYSEVPALVGPVVENPGGDLAYGAPIPQQQAAPYQPPAGDRQALVGASPYGYSHAPTSEMSLAAQGVQGGHYAPPAPVPQPAQPGSYNNV